VSAVRGGSNLQAVQGENIVALCDVSARAWTRRRSAFPRRGASPDFRALFDHAREFDAIVVQAPQHTHAFPTMLRAAAQQARLLRETAYAQYLGGAADREAAAKTKVATQMGIQIHATENYRRVVEIVQSGALGPVREVQVWVSRPWGWQSAKPPSVTATSSRFTERRRRHPVPQGSTGNCGSAGAAAPVPRRLRARAEVVSLVGFGSGTNERSGQPLIDLPFLGAAAAFAPDGFEASGPPPPPRDRPRIHERDVSVRRARASCRPSALTLASG